jgi:hypothetical protein
LLAHFSLSPQLQPFRLEVPWIHCHLTFKLVHQKIRIDFMRNRLRRSLHYFILARKCILGLRLQILSSKIVKIDLAIVCLKVIFNNDPWLALEFMVQSSKLSKFLAIAFLFNIFYPERVYFFVNIMILSNKV